MIAPVAVRLATVYCAGTKRDGRPCRARLCDVTLDEIPPGFRMEQKCSRCNALTILTAEGRSCFDPRS